MSENMKPVCEEKGPLTDELLRRMNAYWRATNYLAAGQLYLLDNPLLREPLTMEQIKKKIVGHWGTVPGQNFVYVHLNRVIKRYDLDMILLSGPGHGGNFFVANTYLEGTYSEVYPNVKRGLGGHEAACSSSSPSRAAFPAMWRRKRRVPSTRAASWAIRIAHAFGASFRQSGVDRCLRGRRRRSGDRPAGDLVAVQQVFESRLARWRGSADPASERIQDQQIRPYSRRISHAGAGEVLQGLRLEALLVVSGRRADGPCIAKMAEVVDQCRCGNQGRFRRKAREERRCTASPLWPMIVLRTPKGWTGPKEVDGKVIEGTFRAHQVPIMHGQGRTSGACWRRGCGVTVPEELFGDD